METMTPTPTITDPTINHLQVKLTDKNDPILRTPTTPWDFSTQGSPEEIVNGMLMAMSAANGIGLAANQVGLPYRIFVVHGDPFAVINPRIVDVSQEEVELDEGCLTLPKYTIKIKRPKSIRLRWNTIKGETETKTFTGMTARVIQHELDHLNGVWFYTRASRYHRDQATRQQAQKLKRS